jgi:hypothetical protein
VELKGSQNRRLRFRNERGLSLRVAHLRAGTRGIAGKAVRAFAQFSIPSLERKTRIEPDLREFVPQWGGALQLAKKGVLNTFRGVYARHIGLQLISSSGIVILGMAICHRAESAMTWPVAIIVALLGSASWNAWELLFKE